IELATLTTFGAGSLAFLDLLTQSIGAVFNTIEATMRTEGLLTHSQQLTVELQSRQSELQQTNEELGTKAKLLADQNAEVERKNAEVEQARYALEEQAAELALTSKYKSEFLANMSHELRTPLNSILILSQQLAGNSGGNLSTKQVEFSRNINSSGSDLLNLINDILDLSKIESGTVTVEVEEIPFAGLRDNIDRNFRHVAEAKNLPFQVQFAEDLPRTMDSDPKRLQQILKNLLSNAVKFTTQGQVEVRVGFATHGWSPDHPVLSGVQQIIAFAVEDTGIGVAPEKQRIIFEAFQQADAGTSRKYGGTGLGLAISRELAVLLGGEIKLVSVHGQGSTFTLFLPLH
ncbi:MAG: ATP-binding protein, partial [Candidatus Deferrimicrobium sp.]|nr:ATP-binding protein [Candidatus Deferrimicrobium sp.]